MPQKNSAEKAVRDIRRKTRPPVSSACWGHPSEAQTGVIRLMKGLSIRLRYNSPGRGT